MSETIENVTVICRQQGEEQKQNQYVHYRHMQDAGPSGIVYNTEPLFMNSPTGYDSLKVCMKRMAASIRKMTEMYARLMVRTRRKVSCCAGQCGFTLVTACRVYHRPAPTVGETRWSISYMNRKVWCTWQKFAENILSPSAGKVFRLPHRLRPNTYRVRSRSRFPVRKRNRPGEAQVYGQNRPGGRSADAAPGS